MAFDTGPERTEEATLKRREEAREQGQVAFSAELVGGLVVLAALLKVAVLAAVAYAVLHGRVGTLTGLGYGRLAGSVAAAWELCLRLALWLAAALALFGVADYAWQWRRFEASIRMTKQEVKE